MFIIMDYEKSFSLLYWHVVRRDTLIFPVHMIFVLRSPFNDEFQKKQTLTVLDSGK